MFSSFILLSFLFSPTILIEELNANQPFTQWLLETNEAGEITGSATFKSLDSISPVEYLNHFINYKQVISADVIVGGIAMKRNGGQNSSCSYLNLMSPKIHFALPVKHAGQGQYYFSWENPFNFVTCSTKTNDYNFSVYLAPFDVWIWICGLISLAFATGAIYGILKKIGFFYFKVYEIAFLVATNPTLLVSKVSKRAKIIMFIVSLWMTTELILSNGYKGVIVKKLIAPDISADNFPNSLADLMENNFTIFTLKSLYSPVTRKEYDWSKLFSTFGRYLVRLIKPILEELDVECEKSNVSFNCLDMKSRYAKYIDVWNQITMIKPKELKKVLNQVEMCDKSAFIAPNEELMGNFKNKLLPVRSRINQKELFYGNGLKIKEINIFWTFADTFDGSLVPDRLKIMLSSGIFMFWKNLQNRFKYFGIRDIHLLEFVACGLHSNFATLFVIFGVGIATSLLCFGGEVIRLKVKKSRKF